MRNLGDSLRDGERFAAAEAWYRRAIKAGDPDASLDLAFLLEDLCRWDEAIEWFQGIIDAADCGDTNDALRGLARCLVALGAADEAQRFLEVAASRGDPDAAAALGDLLRDGGRPDEAQAAYRRSADLGSWDGMHALAGLLRGRGQLSEAEEWYRRAIVENMPEAMAGLAELLEETGRSDEAEFWAAEAARVEEEQTEALVFSIFYEGVEADGEAK